MSRRTRKSGSRSGRHRTGRRSRRSAQGSAPQELARGLELQQSGQLHEAAAIYRSILEKDPRHPDALHLLGLIELQTGQEAAAIDLLTRAATVSPTAEFFSDLGMACMECGDVDAARQALSQAVAINPRSVAALYNFGVLESRLGRFECARNRIQSVVDLDPLHFRAHNNLGSALQELGHPEQAADSFRRALEISPNSPVILRNLGSALHEAGHVESAAECYRSALAIAPSPGTEVKLITCAGPVELSNAAIAQRRDALRRGLRELSRRNLTLEDPYVQVGKAPFYLAYHGENDREIMSELAAFYLGACPELGFTAPHCRKPRAVGQPLRVGFLSRYLHDHPVGRHFAGLVRHFPDDFSVTLLKFDGPTDAISVAIEKCVDKVITLPEELPGARHQIAELELDILVYTDVGMDPLTWFLAFARLAPVQCVLPGHPVTTGIPNMDYFLSCKEMEPADAPDHYTEQLVCFEHIPNHFEKPVAAPCQKPLSAYGLDESHHNYLCVQTLFKIHPDFDLLMQDILRRDPLGRIVLFGNQTQVAAQRLFNRFQTAIADVAHRIVMVPRVGLPEFLHLLTLGSCVLDTIHFSGGTTTAYALGVGAPVVTLPGSFFRGRTTSGMLQRMNVTDCIANTPEDYAELAVRLGTDPDWRADVRKQILTRHDAIFAQPGAALEIAAFLRQATATAGNAN